MSALLQVGWEWHPSVVIGFCLVTTLYTWLIRRNRAVSLAQQLSFYTGTLVGLLALVSPLDKLGDEFLFSAHMVQHLLLMFVVAPFWLIGMPGWLVDRIIPEHLTGLARWLVSPISTLLIFVGVMYFWHIPSIYMIAQENETIHIVEHLTFIAAALVGWWPVAGANSSRLPRPEPPLRMLYLFLLAIPCTGIAAIFTFADRPLYQFYVAVPHSFGLSALQDQHLGGLLMWLPTHMILLLALGLTFRKWIADSNRHEEPYFG